MIGARLDNWILMPCHNSSALLYKALPSILTQTIPVRIFAINNGSKDNTAFVLKELGNDHVVVNCYPQLGVAGAWNYGLSYLFEKMGADKVLVLNQDIQVRPDTYEQLRGENAPFISAVSTMDVQKLHDIPEWHPGQGRRPHPDFSCYLISDSCYERVGPFDEGFHPAWFEDNDYHIRAARAGIELACVDLPFYHYAAGTVKTASDYDRAHYYDVGFRKSRDRFQAKWGVLPGTKEYEEMCDPAYWAS